MHWFTPVVLYQLSQSMCSIKRAHKRKYLQLNLFLEAAAQRKKTTPNTEQSQKFLIDQFQDAIQKKKEMCEDRFTTKRGTKWPSDANNGWSKCGTRNRIHRLKQSSWHKKGKYCMMRRPIQRLFPLGVNKGNMLGNEPTINCLADLNTTKTSSSS